MARAFQTILVIFFLCLVALAPSRGLAQVSGPAFFVTWQAQSYVPPGFPVKALPTSNSTVVVSFDLISGGRLVDLSNQMVYWYSDDNFVDSGVGMQRIVLSQNETAGNYMKVRIELPGYGDGQVLKTITIPTVNPAVVIESPSPGDTYPARPITLYAWPYFFNALSLDGLTSTWTVNGETPSNTESPWALTINTAPSGSAVQVEVAAQNPSNAFETASNSKNITFQ